MSTFEEELANFLIEKCNQDRDNAEMMEQDLRNIRCGLEIQIRVLQQIVDTITDRLQSIKK
jgi:hypothetical protein